MVPCPSCGTHLRARDRACFSCGASAAPGFPRSSAAALLLGLSVACTGTTTTKPETDPTGDTGTTVQPLYGVTPTDGYTTEETGTVEHTATYTGGVDYGVHTALELHTGEAHSGGHSGR